MDSHCATDASQGRGSGLARRGSERNKDLEGC